MAEQTKASRRYGRGRLVEEVLAPSFGGGREGRARSYEAFVPDPVRDLEVRLTGETAQLVSEAEAGVRELNRPSEGLVSLEGLARQLLRSEALASSAIEGLMVSNRKLARAAHDPSAGDFQAREVVGNMRAMAEAIDLGSRSKPIRVADIQRLHELLAASTHFEKYGGSIRAEPGWVGGTTPANADYVPAPHQHLPGLLEDLCGFIGRTDLPPVVQAAITHAQFETVHPFVDGNGRVGRCLIHVVLRQRGLSPRYVPPISLVFGADKDSYIAGLKAFEKDEVEDWVSHFARATGRAVDEAGRFSEEIAELQRRWLERAGRPRRDSTAWRIIEQLPAHPVIDSAAVQEIAGTSEVAARNALNSLEAADVLRARNNRKRDRSWEAPELFDLVDRAGSRSRLDPMPKLPSTGGKTAGQ